MNPSFRVCPVCGVWIDSHGRCNCNSHRPSLTLALLPLLLLAGSTCPGCMPPEPEPIVIIGPAPCHSDTPGFCGATRIYMPIISAGQ